MFSFSGVDEEPDFLDEVLDGDAFGYALLAAAGFGSFAVALFACFAGWFATVAVAFDGGGCAAGFGWLNWCDGAAHVAGFAAAVVSLSGWAGSAWCGFVSAGFQCGVAGLAGFVVSFVAAACLACTAGGDG